MAENKRSADDAFKDSPFLSMFEQLRIEIDEHHDRRERINKASRDITAASKKIIFALQRVKNFNESLPKQITQSCKPHYHAIETAYKSIASDLQGINAFRYSSIITHGNQELLEAILFENYIQTQELMTPDQAQNVLSKLCPQDSQLSFTTSDYLLGIFDMTGELMKSAITLVATSNLNEDDRTKVLSDLRHLRIQLESLHIPQGLDLAWQVSKKLEVTQNSVDKVEKAYSSKTIRGAEKLVM